MRHRAATLAGTVVLTLAVASPPSWAAGSSSVTVRDLPSSDVGRTSRSVWIYHPAVPDTATLPVVYLLHGQQGNPRDPLTTGLQQTLDDLFRRGWPPFVVAVPQGGSHRRSDDEWGDATDRSDRLETFVTHDVIGAVEGSHPRDRSHRAVAGFSMGGYAAAFDAALHPSVFGQLVSFAGYFHVDDPQGVWGRNRAVEERHTPLSHADWLNRTRVLLLDATQENDPVIRGELDRFARALSQAGHSPGTRVTGGGHDWTWVNSQWGFVVRFLTQGWGR